MKQNAGDWSHPRFFVEQHGHPSMTRTSQEEDPYAYTPVDEESAHYRLNLWSVLPGRYSHVCTPATHAQHTAAGYR